MKKNLSYLTVILICFILIFHFGCTKSRLDVSQPKSSDIERPLSSLKNLQSSSVTNAIAKSASPQVMYGCGSNLSGIYSTSGYYRYPDDTLNFSSSPNPTTITISVSSYDVPDRFTVYDGNGNEVTTSGWMGYTSNSGPWGQSLHTSENQSLIFTKSTSTYRLEVETVVQGNEDNWNASVACAVPTTITATYAGVTITYEVSNKILRFNSVSDVNTVLNKLEADYDTYNDNYDSQYPNYTTDQLDSVDAVNNFNEYKTVIDFENLFSGYSSKRKGVAEREAAWLSSNFTSIDPDSLDYTFDDFENAICNSNYSFKIGTDVYQETANGLYINGSYQGGTGPGSNHITQSPNLVPPCMGGRITSFFNPAGTNHRYKLKAAVHSIIFRSSAKGKVVSFKQKGSGWKRSRSEMDVTCGGNIYTTQCTLNFNFQNNYPSPSGFKKRRELKVVYRQYGAGGAIIYKTKPNEFGSTFGLSNGYSASILLH